MVCGAGGLVFMPTLSSVTERQVIDGTLLCPSDARRVDGKAGQSQKPFARHRWLVLKDKEHPVTGPMIGKRTRVRLHRFNRKSLVVGEIAK